MGRRHIGGQGHDPSCSLEGSREIHRADGDPSPCGSSPPRPYCRLREGEREGSVPTDGRGCWSWDAQRRVAGSETIGNQTGPM